MESCRAGLCRRHLRHNPAGRISPAAAVARSPWPTVCRRLCGPGRQDGPRRGPAALAVSSRHHPVSFPHAGHLAGAVRGAASVPHRAYAEGVVRDDRRRLRGPAGRSRRRWGGRRRSNRGGDPQGYPQPLPLRVGLCTGLSTLSTGPLTHRPLTASDARQGRDCLSAPREGFLRVPDAVV